MSEKIKQIQGLLSGPYGILIAFGVSLWYVSNMSDAQIGQLSKVWPLLNTPLGWLIVGFGIVIFLIINFGKVLDRFLIAYHENTLILKELREDIGHIVEKLVILVDDRHICEEKIDRTEEKLDDLLRLHKKRESDYV